MGKEKSDFDLSFLDYPSGEIREGQISSGDEEAEALDAYSRTVTSVVSKVGPAVVHIHIKKKHARAGRGYEEEGSGSG
ncbi:MAG: hypothetical protein HY665_05315, partial [Chloroflexi bacterium]|nr:hypothetical protein [Chloroflexota bacterium]